MYGGLQVAAVVPAWNEEALVGKTISTLPRFVDRVILVDDGSRDDTEAAARAVGDARLSVLRHSSNRGVGAAVVTGYREALSLGVDAAVVVGADAQMDPREMDRLLEPLVAGTADYVKGTRLRHPELRRRMPLSRRVGNRVLTGLTRVAVSDGSITDSQCGYTAISRQALERLPLERIWPRYGYPNDLLAHARRCNLRIVERPVTPIYADEVSGIRAWREIPTFSYVLGRAWWRRRR